MARFYLVNSLRTSAGTLSAGRLVDDSVVDVAALRRAGAVLVSDSTAAASAAALVLDKRRRRGIDEATASAIMRSAVAAPGVQPRFSLRASALTVAKGAPVDDGALLRSWGSATNILGSPRVIEDTVVGGIAVRTSATSAVSTAPRVADFLSAGPSTVVLEWRTTKFNYGGSSYPILDTTDGGTVPGYQILAREDYAFGDFRRFEVRIWDGSQWRIGLPGGQNGGHWIPLKWHVIVVRLTATTLDVRIDGRYVDVNPEPVTFTFPAVASGALTIGRGPSDYRVVDLYDFAMTDAEVEVRERQVATNYRSDLLKRVAGDLRAPASAESYVGFPGLTRLDSGSLRLTYFVGATESTNDNRVDVQSSEDDGGTWGGLATINRSTPADCLANINITVLSNGDWVGTSYRIASASIQHLMLYRSKNRGATWTVTEIPPVGGAVWEGCSGFIVEDPDVPGKLYWPVYSNEGGTYNHIWAYVSLNYGYDVFQTRHRIANGDADQKYWAEPQFIFRGGEMYVLIRDAEPPNFENPPNEMYQSRSTDRAVTWAPPVTTTLPADSAGQSLTHLPSGADVWVGRPGGRRMAALFYRPPGAAWNDPWSNIVPTPGALWLDVAYGGFGGMSYAGLVVTGRTRHPRAPAVMTVAAGATTDADHDDVWTRRNVYEWYMTFEMPGEVGPKAATLAAGTTLQVSARGAGGNVYAFTDNPTGSSISADGVFTAGNTAGTSTFTVHDCNGQLLETCTYDVLGGGGGFTPPQAAHVVMHLRPQDAGTVSASGGLASSITNLAGGSSAFVQADNTLKPGYGSAQINGLNVLDCEGGKVMGGTVPSGVNDLTLVMVVRDVASSAGYHGHMGSTDLSGPAFYIRNGLMAIYDYQSGGECDAVTNAIADGTNHVLAWRRVGNVWDYFVDGVKVTTDGARPTPSAMSNAQFIGATSAAAGNPSGNWIGEVYLYDVGLTDDEYLELLAHMQAEWGTPS